MEVMEVGHDKVVWLESHGSGPNRFKQALLTRAVDVIEAVLAV